MKTIRQVRDRDLSEEQKAKREEARRRHEIDAQILVAIEKYGDGKTEAGRDPLENLLVHPAGLLGKGSAGWLHKDKKQEEAYIRNRYNQLKARFDAGTEYQDLDAEIAAEIQGGKRKGDRRLDALSAIKVRGVRAQRGEIDIGPYPRARALKDYSLLQHEEAGLAHGWLRQPSQEELVTEHEANVQNCLDQINAERDQFGLPRLRVVEE